MADPIHHFVGKYRFLSNFYLCQIHYEGIDYPSTEHAYQAAKTDKNEIRHIIACLDTPSEAKRAGQKIEKSADCINVLYLLCMKYANRSLNIQH